MTRAYAALAAAALAVAACAPRPTPGGAAATRPVDGATLDVAAGPARADTGLADVRPGGISHEDLMRLFSDAGAAAQDEVAAPGREIAPDQDFTGEAAVTAVRARYTISLPDEHATIATERAFRVDDQGDRASVMLVGTGLPAVPGMRVMARAGLAGFALVSPDGARYRAATPDELQRWFLGTQSRAGTTVAFRRTDDTVVAARGGFQIIIVTDRAGPMRPLACRALVALFLGGDPAAARVGCAGARLPVRAGFYARGWRSVLVERAESAPVDLPRRALAVPPAAASPDLEPPRRAPSGAFFAPTELAALGGVRTPAHTLTVHNGLAREALIFVDELAIGWVEAGGEALFVGLSAGPHAVRGRSLDGYERSVSRNVTFPASVRIENAPQLVH